MRNLRREFTRMAVGTFEPVPGDNSINADCRTKSVHFAMGRWQYSCICTQLSLKEAQPGMESSSPASSASNIPSQRLAFMEARKRFEARLLKQENPKKAPRLAMRPVPTATSAAATPSAPLLRFDAHRHPLGSKGLLVHQLALQQ